MKINKKSIEGILLMTMMTFTLLPATQASAKVPYSTPWGAFYRTPEKQNKYGRCWYSCTMQKQHFDIYMESYYTYGSYASVTYTYRDTKKRQKQLVRKNSSAHGSSCAAYTKSVKGTFVRGRVYGSAHGITVDKTYK